MIFIHEISIAFFFIFNTYYSLEFRLKLKNIEHVPQVGKVLMKSLYTFVSDEKNLHLVKKLIPLLTIQYPLLKSGPLQNKKIAFTGKLNSFNREEAKNKALSQGAKIESYITKKTDILVLGEKPGSKLHKARINNTKIISEQCFLKIIDESLNNV